MSVDRVTRAELAKLLGRAERTVSRLEEAGVVKPVRAPRRGQVTRFALGPKPPARSLPTRRPSGPRWRRPRPVRAGCRGGAEGGSAGHARRAAGSAGTRRAVASRASRPGRAQHRRRDEDPTPRGGPPSGAGRPPRTHEPLVKRFITEALRELADIRTVARAAGGDPPEDIVTPDELIEAVMSAFSPPPELTVSEWAELHRRLPASSPSKGARWSNSTAPYLTELQDAACDPEVRKLVVMGCSQSGKSEALHNALGFWMQHDPSNLLWVMPSFEDARRRSRGALADMIRSTPSLRAVVRGRRAPRGSHEAESTLLEKVYPGGSLILAGSGTPNSFAGVSRPPRDRGRVRTICSARRG